MCRSAYMMHYGYVDYGRCRPRQPRVTMEEFLNCLRYADTNGDGLISQLELQNALRALGIPFPRLKARRAMAISDGNFNRAIDNDEELKRLLEYARMNWGIQVE